MSTRHAGRRSALDQGDEDPPLDSESDVSSVGGSGRGRGRGRTNEQTKQKKKKMTSTTSTSASRSPHVLPRPYVKMGAQGYVRARNMEQILARLDGSPMSILSSPGSVSTPDHSREAGRGGGKGEGEGEGEGGEEGLESP